MKRKKKEKKTVVENSLLKIPYVLVISLLEFHELNITFYGNKKNMFLVLMKVLYGFFERDRMRKIYLFFSTVNFNNGLPVTLNPNFFCLKISSLRTFDFYVGKGSRHNNLEKLTFLKWVQPFYSKVYNSLGEFNSLKYLKFAGNIDLENLRIRKYPNLKWLEISSISHVNVDKFLGRITKNVLKGILLQNVQYDTSKFLNNQNQIQRIGLTKFIDFDLFPQIVKHLKMLQLNLTKDNSFKIILDKQLFNNLGLFEITLVDDNFPDVEHIVVLKDLPKVYSLSLKGDDFIIDFSSKFLPNLKKLHLIKIYLPEKINFVSKHLKVIKVKSANPNCTLSFETTFIEKIYIVGVKVLKLEELLLLIKIFVINVNSIELKNKILVCNIAYFVNTNFLTLIKIDFSTIKRKNIKNSLSLDNVRNIELLPVDLEFVNEIEIENLKFFNLQIKNQSAFQLIITNVKLVNSNRNLLCKNLSLKHTKFLTPIKILVQNSTEVVDVDNTEGIKNLTLTNVEYYNLKNSNFDNVLINSKYNLHPYQVNLISNCNFNILVFQNSIPLTKNLTINYLFILDELEILSELFKINLISRFTTKGIYLNEFFKGKLNLPDKIPKFFLNYKQLEKKLIYLTKFFGPQ